MVELPSLRPSFSDATCVSVVIEAGSVPVERMCELIGALGPNLATTPFPELKAVVVSGPYAEATSAKNALSAWIGRVSQEQSDEEALTVMFTLDCAWARESGFASTPWNRDVLNAPPDQLIAEFEGLSEIIDPKTGARRLTSTPEGGRSASSRRSVCKTGAQCSILAL